VAGTGVILLTAAIFFLGSGLIGELVYRLGDVRQEHLSSLTSEIWGSSRESGKPEDHISE
jgi:hypothetical protein